MYFQPGRAPGTPKIGRKCGPRAPRISSDCPRKSLDSEIWPEASVAAVWLETKMYILVLAIFGHFPAELGSRTVLNGFSLKNGAEFTQNHPRRPILRPFGGHFPV